MKLHAGIIQAITVFIFRHGNLSRSSHQYPIELANACKYFTFRPLPMTVPIDWTNLSFSTFLSSASRSEYAFGVPQLDSQ
jgi:hypothetical protein